MAKDKKEQAEKKLKDAKETQGKLQRKKRGLGVKGTLVFSAIILCGVIFLPTSMLLFIGMLPSIVAFFVSAKGRGARASTVTAMNIAGCIPFVFKLWSGGNDFETSFDIVTNSQSIAVMYTAAAFGYMIDWFVTGIVSSFLYQKGIGRMKAIKERQKVLVENWGEDVTGLKSVKDQER